MTAYSLTVETRVVHAEGCRWYRTSALAYPRHGAHRRERACDVCLPDGLPEIVRVGPYRSDWMTRPEYAALRVHNRQRDQLDALRVTRPDREPGECGDCRDYDDFDWSDDRWENNAPAMVCRLHGALAPGWAYDGPLL